MAHLSTSRRAEQTSGFRLRAWERHPTPVWSHTAAARLYLLAVVLIPVQLESDQIDAIFDTRLAPGDLVLALAVVLAPASLRLAREPMVSVPIGLLLVLCYGIIAALVVAGDVSDHALTVKFLGATVLVVLGLVTMSFAREGHGPRILRIFVLGVVITGVIAYIDWQIADVVPMVQHRSTRFSGMVADPNNSGALYGATMLLAARYGHRLFETRRAWFLSTALLAYFFAETLSRGAFIAAAIAVIAMIAVDRIDVGRASKLALGGLLVLGTVVATGFAEKAVDDFSRRPDNVGDRNSLISDATDLWVESNGIGAGLGSIRVEVGEIVHNTGVWLVAEMSLPGLIFLGVVVTVPIGACLRLRRHDQDLAIALIGVHVFMCVAAVGIEALYQRTWWVMMGCMVTPVAGLAVVRQPSPADGSVA